MLYRQKPHLNGLCIPDSQHSKFRCERAQCVRGMQSWVGLDNSVRGIGQGNWSWKVLNTVKRVSDNNDIETRECSCGTDFNPHNIRAIIQCNLSSWQFFFCKEWDSKYFLLLLTSAAIAARKVATDNMYANGLAGFRPWAMVWPLLTWFKACYLKNFYNRPYNWSLLHGKDNTYWITLLVIFFITCTIYRSTKK